MIPVENSDAGRRPRLDYLLGKKDAQAARITDGNVELP